MKDRGKIEEFVEENIDYYDLVSFYYALRKYEIYLIDKADEESRQNTNLCSYEKW